MNSCIPCIIFVHISNMGYQSPKNYVTARLCGHNTVRDAKAIWAYETRLDPRNFQFYHTTTLLQDDVILLDLAVHNHLHILVYQK